MATLFDNQTRPSIRNRQAGRHRPRSPLLSSPEAWSSTWRYSPTRAGWIPANNGQTPYHHLLLRSPRLSPTLFPRPLHLSTRAVVQQPPFCVQLVPLLTFPYRVCRRLRPQPIKDLVNLFPKLNLLHIRPEVHCQVRLDDLLHHRIYQPWQFFRKRARRHFTISYHP